MAPVCGGVVAFRDITQKRNSEREIQTLNAGLEHRVAVRTAQLEEANQELNPLPTAWPMICALRCGISQASPEFCWKSWPCSQCEADVICSAFRRDAKMGRLVDELLTLARVGRQELSPQVAGLNSIVTEVIGVLQPEFEGRRWNGKSATCRLLSAIQRCSNRCSKISISTPSSIRGRARCRH